MANYRQVHVSIWKDAWFLDLDTNEKLLFVYLFTNESTNLAGLYKIAPKVIAFETGLEISWIADTLKKFSDVGKVFYEDGIVWIVNMRKYHETTSSKIQTRIQADINSLPEYPIKQRYIEYYNSKIPYRYLIDTTSLKEEEEEEKSKEEERLNNHDYSRLSAAFVNATQIPELTGGVNKWVKALDELGKAGVEEADIENAVTILREKDYSITSLSSIVNAAISEMSKRKGKKVQRAQGISYA